MARRTPSELYQDAIAAGLSPAAAVVQTAIALASTGGDVDARADAGGVSAVGAYLTRVDPVQTGTGSARDVARVAGDARAQAAVAAEISQGGRDWSAWEAFRNGQYAEFLGQAQAAASAAAQASPAAGPGPDWAPWNWGQSADATMAKLRELGVMGLVVGAGVLLVGLGAVELLAPRLVRRAEQSLRVAKKAVL